MTTTLFDLPDEILVGIIALTRPSTRRAAQLATVCSRFQQIAMDDGVWKGVFRRAAFAAHGFELTRPEARNAAGHLLSWRKLARRLAQTKVDVRILAFPQCRYNSTVSVYRDDGVSTYALCAARTSTRLASLILGNYMHPPPYFTVWQANVTNSDAVADVPLDTQSRLVEARLLCVLHTHGSRVADAHAASPWWWADWSTACAHERPRLSITCMFARTKSQGYSPIDYPDSHNHNIRGR